MFRLGTVVREVGPGNFRLKLPYPLERVVLVETTVVRRTDIEAAQLNKHYGALVLWQVKSAKAFLLNRNSPEQLVRDALIRATTSHQVPSDDKRAFEQLLIVSAQRELDGVDSGLGVVDLRVTP